MTLLFFGIDIFYFSFTTHEGTHSPDNPDTNLLLVETLSGYQKVRFSQDSSLFTPFDLMCFSRQPKNN